MQETTQLILGIDEAGRGALAGPVVVAGVVLDPNNPIEGLKDSKKLTPKQRERLAEEICTKSLYLEFTCRNNKQIDAWNILEATKDCVNYLGFDANNKLYKLYIHTIADGHNLIDYRDTGVLFSGENVIKADSIYPEVMAASIIAKTVRDDIMRYYDYIYPGYDFAQSKGYPSPKHIEAIKKLGPCPIHRKTFKRVKEYVQDNNRSMCGRV